MQLFTPLQYLYIDIANNFGLDKLSWDDRIQWTQENLHQLESLTAQAETAPLFFAAVQALRNVEKGIPTGYPISLDATASGAQILALMAGCESSASMCNMTDVGTRMDLYTAVYEAMLAESGGDAKLTREQCKTAIMTSLYGSTAQPIKMFGTGPMLQLFYKIMETKVEGAWKLNQDLLDMWQEYELSHSWVMPDGFEVDIPIVESEARFIHFMNAPVQVDIKVNKGTKKGLSLPANVTHSLDSLVLREMHRRCSYDTATVTRVLELLLGQSTEIIKIPNKFQMFMKLWDLYLESGFLSARILDYIDAETINLSDVDVITALVKSLPEKPFNMLSTHDCYRVLPTYGNDLRIQYNRVMAQLADSDMLQFLASQIMKMPIKVTRNKNLYDKVLTANYALS